MDDIARDLGANIRAGREAAGLSQDRLADLLDVHQTTVSHWELGYGCPPHRLIPALAAALGVEPSDLLPYGKVA